MDAVKLEGGSRARVRAVEAVGEAGIAVMGHVGLTPQAISSLGGFRPQGRTAKAAMEVSRKWAAWARVRVRVRVEGQG